MKTPHSRLIYGAELEVRESRLIIPSDETRRLTTSSTLHGASLENPDNPKIIGVSR